VTFSPIFSAHLNTATVTEAAWTQVWWTWSGQPCPQRPQKEREKTIRYRERGSLSFSFKFLACPPHFPLLPVSIPPPSSSIHHLLVFPPPTSSSSEPNQPVRPKISLYSPPSQSTTLPRRRGEEAFYLYPPPRHKTSTRQNCKLPQEID